MISTIGFLNSSWLLPVLVVAIVLLLIFLWKEWATKTQNSFYLRLLMLMIAIVSLACIALKPTMTIETEASQLVILTEGYSESTLDSMKRVNPLLKLVDYAPSKPLIDIDNKPTSVVVLGNGLETYDLYQLQNYNTQFIAGDSINGITKLLTSRNNIVGSDIVIKGSYEAPEKGKRLYLESPDGSLLDSIIFKNNSTTKFSLSTQAKTPGLFTFNLLEKDSVSGTTHRDTLAIEIIPQKALRILMLNSFPTFESKYLKNFLAENGHELVVRNQLSKARYKYEYFNTNSGKNVQITAKNLSKIDIVILDYQSLTWLSGNQQRILENAINEEGLGLFIQPEPAYFNTSNRFNPFKFKRDNVTSTTIDRLDKISFDKWPFYMENEPLTEAIHQNKGRILSGYQRLQLGRVATTTVNNSYFLILNGNTRQYKQYWSDILNNVSKQQHKSHEWETVSRHVTVNEPFDFILRTFDEHPQVTSTEGSIPLQQNVNIPTTWKGRTYPTKTGWNQLKLRSDSLEVYNYFVSSRDNFKALKATRNLLENQQFFNKVKTSDNIEQEKPINLLWFYIAFLIAMITLWISPKL